MDNSSLYESDFPDEDEIDHTSSVSDRESDEEKDNHKPPRRTETDSKAITSISSEIVVDDESVIILDKDMNYRITLPFLRHKKPRSKSKASIYDSKNITIISNKSSLEHIIMCREGNLINGNSSVYCLKGGNSVVFHSVGTIWYADR